MASAIPHAVRTIPIQIREGSPVEGAEMYLPFQEENECDDHRSHVRQPREKRLALFRAPDP